MTNTKPHMTNPKEFFSTSISTVDGHLLTNDEEMVREFNNYFSNVFIVDDVDNIPDPVIVHAVENTITDIDCVEP